MEYKLVSVEMTSEHFERSIKGSPRDAVKELIWNACDADAKSIEVTFDYEGIGDVQHVSGIHVKDDGHGISYEHAEEYFGKYGRSQKTYAEKSPAGRVYHGKLGQGRYKSLAAGSFVEWHTTYQADNGDLLSYEIRIDSGTHMDVRISESVEKAEADHTGTWVYIHGVPDDRAYSVTKLAENEEMVPELLATFAPYLLAYTDVTIKYNNILIDPKHQIESQFEKDLSFEEEGKKPVKARTVVIKWKQSQLSKIYICGASGVVYAEDKYYLLEKAGMSAYLMSDHFEEMHRENTLDMGAADAAYAFFDEEAKAYIKEILHEQETDDAAAEIERIKVEGVYPYVGTPSDEVAKAEMEVFDVLAFEVNRAVPQLRTANTPMKKLTYRLIQEAIKTNPSSIKTILTEVFNLTPEQQDDLAELLNHTHLPQIIDVAKTVSDRLTFLYLLDQMVYNDSVGKPIKERTQFHKILLKELWIFGEKYALGTSDQSLRNLLHAHIKHLGREELIPQILPEATEDLTRIPDICLFEQVCLGYEQYENLVIELKRPTLTLTKKELDQIEDYALTVSDNPLFDKAMTKWNFILLGRDVDSYVAKRLQNKTQGAGNLYNSEDGHVTISVLKWSAVIQENKFKTAGALERQGGQAVSVFLLPAGCDRNADMADRGSACGKSGDRYSRRRRAVPPYLYQALHRRWQNCRDGYADRVDGLQ